MMVISFPRYMFRAAAKVTIGPLYDASTGMTGHKYLQQLYNFNDSLYNKWMDWGIVFSFYVAFFLAASVAFVYCDWFVADASESPNWGQPTLNKNP